MSATPRAPLVLRPAQNGSHITASVRECVRAHEQNAREQTRTRERNAKHTAFLRRSAKQTSALRLLAMVLPRILVSGRTAVLGGHRSKFGIIGAGNIGATLARLLVALGHEVVLTDSRGPHTLRHLADE